MEETNQVQPPPFDPKRPVKQGNVRTFTTVHFGFWERVQILFGVRVQVHIQTNILIQDDEIKSTNAVANVNMLSKMFWKLEAPVGQMSHREETPYDTAQRTTAKEKFTKLIQKLRIRTVRKKIKVVDKMPEGMRVNR